MLRVSFCALLLVAGLGAQPRPVFRGGVEIVTITVAVRDETGRLVSGLGRDDFRVFEDGLEQPISAFTAARVPVSLGVLVDVSDSMYGARMADARKALEQFLTALLRPEDEALLLAFNHAPQLVAPWSLNPATLIERLAALKPFGGTAIYDAVLAALPHLSTRHHQRAALLVISDGADTASDATLTATVQALGRSEGFLYAIAIDPPQRRAINTRVRPEALNALTAPTGGYTEVIAATEELPAATARLAEELNAQYTLAYALPKPPDGEYHTIRVRVPDRKYFVRYRRGYVALPRRSHSIR